MAQARQQTPLAPEDIHTILFTDVEGSTAFTQRLGDAKARDLLREHERTVREALKVHGGFEVKAMGDGFMASFSSATKALECAIAMQRAFSEHNEGAEENRSLEQRKQAASASKPQEVPMTVASYFTSVHGGIQTGALSGRSRALPFITYQPMDSLVQERSGSCHPGASRGNCSRRTEES